MWRTRNHRDSSNMAERRRRSRFVRRGIAATEFAVIAPFLGILILGMFELARGIMVKQMLNDAARRACRVAIQPLKGQFRRHLGSQQHPVGQRHSHGRRHDYGAGERRHGQLQHRQAKRQSVGEGCDPDERHVLDQQPLAQLVVDYVRRRNDAEARLAPSPAITNDPNRKRGECSPRLRFRHSDRPPPLSCHR